MLAFIIFDAKLLFHIEVFSRFTHASALIKPCWTGEIFRVNGKADSVQAAMIQFAKGVQQKSQAKSSSSPLASDNQMMYPAGRTGVTQRAPNRLIVYPGNVKLSGKALLICVLAPSHTATAI